MGNLDCSISSCWNGTREQTGYVGTSTFIRDSYFLFFSDPWPHFEGEFPVQRWETIKKIWRMRSCVNQSGNQFWCSLSQCNHLCASDTLFCWLFSYFSLERTQQVSWIQWGALMYETQPRSITYLIFTRWNLQSINLRRVYGNGYTCNTKEHHFWNNSPGWCITGMTLWVYCFEIFIRFSSRAVIGEWNDFDL